MRKFLLTLALLVPAAAFGQTFSTGGRASVGVDYKAFKGFHISVEEEVRSADNFSALGSLRTSVGVSYKPIKYLKIGVGYTNINPYKSNKEIITQAEGSEKADTSYYNGFWSPRHRVYADVTGLYKLGDFSFSLKERIQFTHNTDLNINPYQTTRNALASKTKLAVKYTGWNYITPYISFEMRAALNEPWGSVDKDKLNPDTNDGHWTTKKTKKEYFYYIPGGSKAYINRLRLNLGVEFEPSKHHSFEPYVMLDYVSDYVIDTNGASKWEEDGIRLWKATTGWQTGFNAIFGLSYTYSF